MTNFGILSARTASARTPSRLTSDMSRTTRTSDSFSAFAPSSLASRTSSPRRNLYISGHGVGFTMRERIPIWPSRRERAVSDPQPSPSALMWVDIATERPAGTSCARRWIDSRRCWGTLRRSSTAFRAGQLRVRSAIEEVDRQSDDHPDDEPLPRREWQTHHHVAADQDSQNGDQRHQRRTERPREIRGLVAQHDDARADDHEREQRSNRHQLTEQPDREESGDDAGDDTSEDRRHVWCLEARMNLSEHRWEESVTRHRKEDSRLPHEHDEHD